MQCNGIINSRRPEPVQVSIVFGPSESSTVEYISSKEKVWKPSVILVILYDAEAEIMYHEESLGGGTGTF